MFVRCFSNNFATKWWSFILIYFLTRVPTSYSPPYEIWVISECLTYGVFSDTSAEDHHVLFYTLFPYSFQFLFESGVLFCEFVVRPHGLAQDRLLHQYSLVCAPNVVVRCSADDPRWPFFESFAAVHRGHVYSNPSVETLLSTDDNCNPSTILNS